MLHPRVLLATIAMAALSLPRPVIAGHLFIQGSSCWCEGTATYRGTLTFSIWYQASEDKECQLTSVAYRIQGVPDDPALRRRFLPFGWGTTGDPFGEGVIVRDLTFAPGNTLVGSFSLDITTPLAPQVWSIEAPQGISGVTSPVAEFEWAPGTWQAQAGYSIRINSANPQCDACLNQFMPLPAVDCPMAVEPATWSTIKQTYK